MSNEQERLLIAQWVLERNLSWVAAAEIKIGFIIALDTALLGSLCAAYSDAGVAAKTAWANVFSIGAGITVVAGIICAAMAVLPRLDGPAKSLVFFGRIVNLDKDSYLEQFKKATDTELLEDWTAQIHRNAEIACEKFSWVRASMCWSFLAIIPWVMSILLLFR